MRAAAMGWTVTLLAGAGVRRLGCDPGRTSAPTRRGLRRGGRALARSATARAACATCATVGRFERGAIERGPRTSRTSRTTRRPGARSSRRCPSGPHEVVAAITEPRPDRASSWRCSPEHRGRIAHLTTHRDPGAARPRPRVRRRRRAAGSRDVRGRRGRRPGRGVRVGVAAGAGRAAGRCSCSAPTTSSWTSWPGPRASESAEPGRAATPSRAGWRTAGRCSSSGGRAGVEVQDPRVEVADDARAGGRRPRRSDRGRGRR